MVSDRGKRRLYFLVGSCVGMLFTALVSAVFKPHGWLESFRDSWSVWISGGIFAMYIAEHKGKVKSREELDRPISLFPPETRSGGWVGRGL